MLDIDAIRKDTPGLGDRLYFDNAGASLPPSCVNETIKAHLDLEAFHDREAHENGKDGEGDRHDRSPRNGTRE